MYPLKHQQKGLSLVELMVALGLSSVLLVGLFQIFNSNKQAFSLQDGVARVQESGRISMEFLSRYVRSSSFLGCASGEASSPFRNKVDTTLAGWDAGFRAEMNRFQGTAAPVGPSDPDEGIWLNSVTGFDNISAAQAVLGNLGINYGGTTAGRIVQGTDAFVLHSAEACSGVTGRVVTPTNTSITTSGSCGIVPNDVVVVSACDRAEMFVATSVNNSGTLLDRGTSHNIDTQFAGGVYSDEGTYLYLPSITAFHVGHTGDGDTALFMTSIQRHATDGINTAFVTQEIARGIYDMQVLYGEDTNGDGTVDRYVDGASVASFDDVVSLRTTIQTRSDDRLTSQSETYTFNGASVTDNRLRVSYETTNTIRNRVN